MAIKVEDVDDILETYMYIAFEEKCDNCVHVYESKVTPCDNIAEDLFDDISVHLHTNNPPVINDNTTIDG